MKRPPGLNFDGLWGLSLLDVFQVLLVNLSRLVRQENSFSIPQAIATNWETMAIRCQSTSIVALMVETPGPITKDDSP